MSEQLGIVVIGRNEGERFINCVASLDGLDAPKVYVDSGSTDGSVAVAWEAHWEVVELDMSQPFSAARARNAGFFNLVEQFPTLSYVLFVDGDCTVDGRWPTLAVAALESNPRLAVVCGRRRERFPERSDYNRLCDMEWNTPVGPAHACGGDFVVRVEAFTAVRGFDSGVIAGEEPELCLRLRSEGWLIERLDADMTLHDADMHRFGQFWQRAVRGGYAYALGYAMHGRSNHNGERYNARALGSIVFWALILPLGILALAVEVTPWLLIALAVFPAQVLRIARHCHSSPSLADRLSYGFFTVVGKFAQLQGVLKFAWTHWRNAQHTIIEYK